MSYPLTKAKFSTFESIDAITASQATILQGLNELFSVDFVDPLLADSNTSGENKILIISSVLNSISNKEASSADILSSLANLLSLEKGILPPTS